MNEIKVRKRYEDCRFQKQGYCIKLKHMVGGSGTSVMAHCGNCKAYVSKEVTKQGSEKKKGGRG